MDVLNALYHENYSLEEYLCHLPGCPVVLQDNDKPGYKVFLKNTIVGIPSGCVTLQQPIRFQQLSDQIEVVLRVIKKLSRQTKTGKNVLLIGWQQAPRGIWTCREPGAADSGHFLPGNTAGQLKTPNWKRLLIRIGDEVMMHLLCNLSVFVKAPPSSYIQLTGTPVYGLIATVTKATIPTASSQKMSLKKSQTMVVGCSRRTDVKHIRKRKRTSSEGNAGILAKRIHQDSKHASTQPNPASQVCIPAATRPNKSPPSMDTSNVDLHTTKCKMMKTKRKRAFTVTKPNLSSQLSIQPAIRPNKRPSSMDASDGDLHTTKCKMKKTKTNPDSNYASTRSNLSSQLSIQTAMRSNKRPSGMDASNVDLHTTKRKKKKTKRKQNRYSTLGINSWTDDKLKYVESKKFWAVDMCYSHGGREQLTKSHPMEATPPNAVGARQLTGLIFNVNSINRENQQTEKTTQTNSDGRKICADDGRCNFTALKTRKVPSHGGEEQHTQGEARDKSVKRKRKPKCTPRRYIKVQKLVHAMVIQHKKTSIYHLLIHHCPVEYENKSKAAITYSKGQQRESNLTLVSRQIPGLSHILSQQSGGPVVFHRRPPPLDDTNQVLGDINERTTAAAESKQDDAAELIAMATPSWQIFLFIRAVIVRVVPHQLWGSMHNRTLFFKYVKRYLQLGRFEKLSLHQLVKDIQISDCDWIKLAEKSPLSHTPPTDVIKRHQMVADFLGWVMEHYVIILVKTMFYVTESSSSRNRLVFFRKPIWHKLERIGAKKLQDSGVMRPITKSVAMGMMKSERSLGYSNLRFLPKTSSLRPIINMGKSCMQFKKNLSINILLQDLFDVLNFIKTNQSALFGSSVLGTDIIYPKWRQFVQTHRQQSVHRQLYFVKLDIEKCYESIQHNKLFQVMTTLLNSQPDGKEFTIRRYATVTVHQGKLQKAFTRHVSTRQEVGSDFHRILMRLAKEDHQIRNAIIVNQVSQHTETPTSLLSRLKQHVNYDVLKSGGQHYIRTSGISQGSILSSLLCSYFYAHMEKCCLAGIDDNGLLLHLVDDFLLVTPHLDKAHRFLNVLLKGLPQYGCHANHSKTLTSFPFEYDGTSVKSVAPGALFPWCGLLFDTSSLHVYNEYARYHGVMVRYTLTMDTSDDAYSAMKSKLKRSLHAKDVCIFVDPLINSGKVIITNSYHMLLMLAFRFHAYYRNLPTSCKADIPTSRLMGLILNMCSHFHDLVRSKLSSHNALPTEDAIPLTEWSVTWLCLKAFWTKLSKHQASYKSLLRTINKHRRKSANMLGGEKIADLQTCCTPDMPYDFTQML